MNAAVLPHHVESSGRVAAPAERVFEHLDDHRRLSAHMTRRTWMMAGSRMVLQLDQQLARAVGSHIRLAGRILGVRLELDEVVTEREPPRRKVWMTVGEPRLVVIGPYRMGFELDRVP
ncbi:MAG TPA: SRPBCC family protein, partial [Myxococcota bacterium]|nr:SRPBCC family protein [Myxococcota bacterium]